MNLSQVYLTSQFALLIEIGFCPGSRIFPDIHPEQVHIGPVPVFLS